jgi:F0F1-type ATP synthase assembly protein I
MSDEIKIKEVKVYQLKDEEECKEVQKWAKELEESMKESEKRLKRFKIFATTLLVFIITIIIAGAVGIFLPQYQYITDKYLIICNLLSTGLSIWTIYNIIKTKLIKDNMGKWLLAVGIFAVIINLYSVYGNLF